jgi:hypothetical protein
MSASQELSWVVKPIMCLMESELEPPAFTAINVKVHGCLRSTGYILAMCAPLAFGTIDNHSQPEGGRHIDMAATKSEI